LRFSSLQDWLDWQQSLHPRAIDLGLDRVRTVLGRLGLVRPAACVLTIGGTNGKGSVVAYLDAILREAGYDVGTFTSPHLVRYNERVRVGGRCATDAELVEAFGLIDEARGDLSLTYFEWNALAAFSILGGAGLDAAVLEVGLGGRLDAVNVIDPDVATIVSVGLDHLDWLGPTVEDIGREMIDMASRLGARLRRLGVDFDFVERPDGWDYVGLGSRRAELPLPAIAGAAQLANAATALAVLEASEPSLLVPDECVRRGLATTRIAGRFQVVEGQPEWILDVAHNADAAGVLAQSLATRPCRGRTLAVCGILGDKDVDAIARSLASAVDEWFAVGLEESRGIEPAELAQRLEAATGRPAQVRRDVAEGCAAASGAARQDDRILVFGSFHAVGPALEWLGLAV